MKRFKKLSLPILFVILFTASIISVKVIHLISDYGTLINYIGIVRGASQRVIKLETNGVEDDTLIDYVDGILHELITGEGQYGLIVTSNREYNDSLFRLQDKWREIKDEIFRVRAGEPAKQLVTDSEELFKVANDTVFAMENYLNLRAASLGRLFFAAAVLCAGLFLVHVHRFFELKSKNEQLSDMARRDKLTGALNLTAFKEDADQIMKENPDLKFAVVYIDIENFKYINDIMGYSFGDDILRKYARIMMDTLQENELLARNVADRFAVLRHYQDKEDLLRVQKLADRNFVQGLLGMQGKQMITVACGLCCVEDVVEKLDTEGLLDRANYAQKTVKNNPGIHYAFYNENIRERMRGENEIKNRMGEALANREFIVYYQPKVGLVSGRIEGAEALVRWQTPDRGLLPPGVFIPILEKNQFISMVDQYVFEEVCRFIARRIKEGKKLVPVSVNVSKIQFYNPNFVTVYARIKNRYQIPAQMLEIEFTETASFENQNYLLHLVNELHENGFRCSLDDFGQGYSSLGMLKELPIDALKLDAMFFRECMDMEKENTIIRSIVTMINELNIESVAEGIEHEEQVEFLKSIGCGMVQGYVFYRPMPESDFEELLGEPKEEERYLKADPITV